MTTWHDEEIPLDEHGHPMFEGILELRNDKNERLGSIVWFCESGPFYAHAMDYRNTSLIRRIGPVGTLDRAKQMVEQAVAGEIDLSERAAYSRF